MGAHIAERSLLLGCLVALVIPAYSLKCHTCVGSDGCSPTEVTCPGDNDKCSTTALYVDSFPCKVQKVFKGCINSTKSSQKISISPNDRITLSLQQRICDSDLCNTKQIPGPNTTQNDLYCHSCISPGSDCNSDTMKTMRCTGEQKLCVDMKVVGSFGDISDVNIKGCGEIPSCTQNLVFSSQTSSVSVQCCNENFCNSGTDSKPEDKTPNGLQCYSCNTLDGSSCSTESVVKAQCYGALTSCLEIEGTFVKDGQTLPTVIKGCATPSICNVPILPLLQKLGTPTVKCCNQSLCNSQYSESGLQASGYLPVGNASPGTGIQNQPSTDATSGGNPLKTEHPAITKYGTGSHSNNGHTDHDKMFIDSESSTVSSPVNYSPGQAYDGMLSPGPSVVLNPIYSVNDGSSIPDAHPTFPDFTSYGEDSFFPNSNSDNDMNFPYNNEYNSYDNGGFTEIAYTDIDFPNSNDLSGGFTDVVYTDLDWNEDPSNSPTVAPDSVGPNSHDSMGSSAYNPNTMLSASNDTGGYSTNTVNNGSNGNVQGNNVNVQNLTSTTPKTHNSDINLHISGYGTNISNMDTGNNNASGNNISSPINYSSGGNNLSVSSTGSSTLGDVLSNYNNNSTSDGSSIPDAHPTFPDFSNYGEDSFFPNSNSDNDMNFPYNNEYNSYDNGGFTEIAYTDVDFPNSDDFGNYESAGFTDVVYTDLGWNEDPSNSPTVAPDSVGPNSHDSIGSSASNPNDILLASNETGGYSTNTVNNGSNGNVPGNNSTMQNLDPTTPKPHNSDSNQQISTYGTNIHNIGTVNNNGSENNISSPIHYSSGGNNLSVSSTGSSTLGGDVLSNHNNNNTSDGSSIPDAHPTFPDFSNYGEDSFFPNSNSDNNMNIPYNNEYNSYDNGGFTEVAYTDIDFPNSNDFSAGFTDVIYTDVDWSEDPSSSPTVATGSVGPNNNDIVGNSGSDTSSSYNLNTIPLTGNNGHSADPVKTKTHNSGIKQHISGHGAKIYNTGITNNNGSGNYISSSGNNTAGSGNSSIAGSSGSSSHGGYINSGNGTGMTNEWNNSNNYSNHNNAMPVGYTNIHGNNSSSSSFNDSSSNGTWIGSEWLDTVVYHSPGDNDSSVSYAGPGGMNGWGNSSNSNMTEHVGHTNINGNNSSTTSYTSTGNGTGIANDISNSNNSKPNTSVPAGYTNMSGSNNSYGSSGNGTGITNSNISNHSMGIPEGYANVPGGNGSSTSYASPGHGTEISNGNSSSNYGMLVPGANVNIPGSNGSSTSYTSSSNGTGMTNEWVNSNGSYHNMASPGGNYGSFNSNGSSHFSDSNHSSNFMIPSNGPTSGNVSNYGGPWDGIESYLNHISSGANNNGSHPNISSWMHEFLPGGSSDSNKTGWIFGSNYDPNMLTNNNDSSSYYHNIQNFLSKLNGSIHSNDSQKINEWIKKNSFFSNLMPPGINNGSGYNVNSMFNRSLSDYFKSLGMSWNNSNIPNIPSMFPSVNNGPFNISNIGSGWSNIMNNPNVKNPHGNEHNSYVIPSGGSNPGAGNNMGHENINNSSHNSNMMVPGVGSGGSSNGGASTDGNGNVHNTNLSGHNTDVLVPGRSANDSTSDGASNGSGSKNGTMSNSATTFWTKSGHFVIFSALALLVLS